MATKKKAKAKGSKATQEINNTQAKVTASQKAYKKSKEYKRAESLQNATIADIAKKYGFDFSKSYANRQAETAAQAQRNAYNSQGRTNDATHQTTLQRLQNAYDSSANDLDKGYFQQFLGTKQNQADRGMNAGIAANQNLQLAMNKQGEVADLWKQRNANTQEEDLRYANQSQTIAEALAQVEKEKYANAENLYQGLLSKGYDILSSDRSAANQWADSAWNRLTTENNTLMDFSKMRVSDIYNEQERADAAAARAAAARRSSAPSGYNGTPAQTSLTPSFNKYNDVLDRQKQTPVQKYVNTISPVEKWTRTLTPTVRRAVQSNSHSIANTPSLSAYDKYKMLF